MESVFLATVSATLDMTDLTARKAPAPYCAATMESMKRAAADAIQDGREQSARFVTMSVRFRTAAIMETALMESVFVLLVSKGTSAIKWTAKTPVVLVMVFVLLEPACVGKAGKVIAVELWTTRGNVSPTAPDMGSLI